jgi:hypothetical protein
MLLRLARTVRGGEMGARASCAQYDASPREEERGEAKSACGAVLPVGKASGAPALGPFRRRTSPAQWPQAIKRISKSTPPLRSYREPKRIDPVSEHPRVSVEVADSDLGCLEERELGGR